MRFKETLEMCSYRSRSGSIALALAFALLHGCGSDGDGGSASAPGGAFERLGLGEADAQRLAIEAVGYGQPYGILGSVGGSFKALDDDEREAVVNGIGEWAREFVRSDVFASGYAELRDAARPSEPVHDESVDDELSRQLAEQREQLRQTREQVATLLPEGERASLLESLDATEASIEDPELVELQRQGLAMARDAERQQYAISLAAWETAYPEDPGVLIRARLEEFLAVCGDVDFDADLEETNGRLRFEASEYEQKPAEWKLCFRAGEPAVAAAREIAKEWLADAD